MIERIVIFGCGGFGREVMEILRDINRSRNAYELIGFLDANETLHGGSLHGFPVLGGTDWLEHNEEVCTVIALGSPAAKNRTLSRFPLGYDRFPALVSPRAWVGDNVSLGRGSIVCAGAAVTVDVQIGEFCTFNLNTTVGHDTRVADFATFAPAVNISGNVVIEMGVEVGTNAAVIPGVRIGEWAIVGAGATVTRDIPDNVTAVGSPARVIKKRDSGWHLQES